MRRILLIASLALLAGCDPSPAVQPSVRAADDLPAVYAAALRTFSDDATSVIVEGSKLTAAEEQAIADAVAPDLDVTFVTEADVVTEIDGCAQSTVGSFVYLELRSAEVNRAEVSVFSFYACLAGYGETYLVEWIDGAWRVTETLETVIS
jgi:hypothetical protein